MLLIYINYENYKIIKNANYFISYANNKLLLLRYFIEKSKIELFANSYTKHQVCYLQMQQCYTSRQYNLRKILFMNPDILFFNLSRLLQGDPKILLGLLFKKRHGYNNNMIFRRNYQGRMSMITSKKNAANIILDHHVRMNEKLSSHLLVNKPKFKYAKGEIRLNNKREVDLEAELLSCIKNNIIIHANHWGINTCFTYDNEALMSCTFRIAHNLTFNQNPTNYITDECIPVIPLGIANDGQIQYITKYMSIFPPLPTSCLMGQARDMILQNEDLFEKYGQTILALIERGELQPIVRSLFKKEKFLTLSDDKIKNFIIEQDQPIILSSADQLVEFAKQEDEALSEFLLNELTKLLEKAKGED